MSALAGAAAFVLVWFLGLAIAEYGLGYSGGHWWLLYGAVLGIVAGAGDDLVKAVVS